jgi:hypothetical protein
MNHKGYYSQLRYERMKRLLDILVPQNKYPDRMELFKAQFAFNEGLTPAKVEEYYQELIKTGLLIVRQ